jgi:hypothetical protein
VILVAAAMNSTTTVWREGEIASSTEPKTLEFARVTAKAVLLDELYGAFTSATAERSDGGLASIIRECTYFDPDTFKWTIVKRTIDPEWIGSMNSLLDDNKMLCLRTNPCADGLQGVQHQPRVPNDSFAMRDNRIRPGGGLMARACRPETAHGCGCAARARAYFAGQFDSCVPAFVEFLGEAWLPVEAPSNSAVPNIPSRLNVDVPIMPRPDGVPLDSAD